MWMTALTVMGVGAYLAGKRDLPTAARWAGTQVGRLVGLFQGAQARADRYAEQSELRALQNELRAGLRELDAVRTEMTTTFSRPLGRQVGSTVLGANRQAVGSTPPSQLSSSSSPASQMLSQATAPNTSQESSPAPLSNPKPQITADSQRSLSSAPLHAGLAPLSSANQTIQPQPPEASPVGAGLASSTHAFGAVAEEEWARQGIDFKSRAELGSGLQQQQQSYDHSTAGSAVLSNLLQQSLVFDQYDRVMQEQKDLLRSKADRIQEQQQNTQHSNPNASSSSRGAVSDQAEEATDSARR